MEHKIQVLSVRASLKDRTITLTCSSDIDEETVSAETIYLSRRSLESIIPLSYECDRKKIILTMEFPPIVNEEYSLAVKDGVLSIVGEPLEPISGLKIVFESSVITTVNIIKPENFTVVGNVVDLVWTEDGPEDKKCRSYQLQVGKEKSFYNIVVESMLDRTDAGATLTASINIKEAGQYFVRMRAVKDGEYGQWSSVITFTIPGEKPEPVPNPQPEEKPRPAMPQIIDLVKKDDSPSSDAKEDAPAVTARPLTPKMVICDDEVPEKFEVSFSAPVSIDSASFTIKRRES